MPGAVFGRFGNRKPPTVSYAAYIPVGPPTLNGKQYVGGMFYDGRTDDLTTQAQMPLQNPNEMNNLVHNVGSPALIVAEVQKGPYAALFKQAYGEDVFKEPTAQVFQLIAQSIAAYESSPAVSPFNSLYDAYVAGKAAFTSDQMAGLQLFTGTLNGRPGGPAAPVNATCSTCHSIASAPGAGPDLFTNSGYKNIGTPKNPLNPYYFMTNANSDPVGYNALGTKYIDYGLGDYLYTNAADEAADPLAVDGMFKTPTCRNVDARPNPWFVKQYGHNGVFKSLGEIVHFYNTRNLTTVPGEVIDFTQPNPYANLQGKPLWPAPEYMGNLNNASGTAGRLGNLGLTPTQEAQLVEFLKTLTDGYTLPRPGRP
jgi:cytochrome c peroxidase